MTSHAAVVARGMGKCCVAGCHEISVDTHQGNFTADGKVSRRPEPRGLCSLTPAHVPLDFMVDSVVFAPLLVVFGGLQVINRGEVITLDGTTGQVLLGDVPRTPALADE